MNSLQKLTLKLFGRYGTYAKFHPDSGKLEVKHIPAKMSLAYEIIPDGKWHWTWLKKVNKRSYEGMPND